MKQLLEPVKLLEGYRQQQKCLMQEVSRCGLTDNHHWDRDMPVAPWQACLIFESFCYLGKLLAAQGGETAAVTVRLQSERKSV